MTELNVGALFGTVELQTTLFDKAYPRVVKALADLAQKAGLTTDSTEKLDEGLASVGTSADKAATGLTRATRTTAQQAAADDKAATAAGRHSAAVARTNAVMAALADESKAVQSAQLRQVAAQDRLATAQQSGTASTARLAGAQASLISASDRAAKAQAAEAASVEKNQAKIASAISTGGKVAVAAAAVIGYESIKAAGNFQQATNVYVTAAGEQQKNLDAVRKGIETVAEKTGTSIDNLTSAEYLIEKAGDHGASGLKLLTAAAEGAREENAQLSDVVGGATSVMASFHIGTGKSVQVINALKTGAGQAKTTFEEYVRSLSTVIPVASAAGLSLGDTLGAVSTLTQHGTSAAEATQELSNTIRNLQAPNNVASKAMQQLNLDVNHLSQNLGRKGPGGGLTGTIDMVTDAIGKKLGPSGLVVVSAFKQSQSATADLAIELSKMPKSLADISREFQTGKMSYKDYYTAVKDLGGQQFELGKTFISTMSQAKGFNDLLKSGSPAAQTFVAYLKKVMGGATGLNTALQLGGKNLDGFKARSDAVTKSLGDNATEVEGWASTQKLFSVEAGRAGASAHVLAIELGNELLPAATKTMNWLATTGVSDLKAFGGEVVDHRGELVALGGAVLGVWATFKLYAILGTVQKAYSALSGSVRAFTALFTTSAAQQQADALAVSATEARAAATVAAAEREKANAAVAAAARITTAAEGASAATLNAAREAQTAAVQQAAAYQSAATAADAAAAQIEADAVAAATTAEEEAAASSIAWGAMLGPIGLIVGGAIGAVTAFHAFGSSAKSAAQEGQAALQKENAAMQTLLDTLESVNGAYTAQYRQQIVKQLGDRGILQAAAQSGFDPQRVVSAVFGNTKDLYAFTDALDRATKAGSISEAQNNKVRESLGLLTADAIDAQQKFDLEASAMGKSVIATKNLSGSYAALRREFAGYLKTLDESTPMGERNTAIIQAYANGLVNAAAKQVQHGKSMQAATAEMKSNSAALVDNLTSLGFDRTAVEGVIGSLVTLAKLKVNPAIHLTGAEQAIAEAAAVRTALAALHNKTITIGEYEVIAKNPGQAVGTMGAFGQATIPPNTAFTVGEDGWEGGVTDSQGRASIFPKTQALAMGFSAPTGYAKGTGNAAANTRASDALTAISVDKTGFSWSKFSSQLAAATAAISAAVRSGATKAQVTALYDRLDRDRSKGRAIEAGLGNSIHGAAAKLGSSADNLKNVASSADIRTQLGTLENLLVQAGVSKSFVKGLHDENKAILGEVNTRNATAKQLAKANATLMSAQDTLKADQSAFKGATTGFFDVTTAGQDANGNVTAGSELAAQTQALTRIKAWDKDIEKAAGMKNFPASYLRTLENQGPTALPELEALLSMSSKDMTRFASQQAQIDTDAGHAASAVAVRLDQPAVTRAQGTVATLEAREAKQQKHLDKSLEHLGDRIVKQIGDMELTGVLKAGDIYLSGKTGEAQAKKATRSSHGHGTPVRH